MASVPDSKKSSTDNFNTESKLKILLVDDSKIIRVAVSRILSSQFELLEAVDGEEAWNLLSTNNSIDLLITDIEMPRLNGYGLVERLRAPENPLSLRNLPVMVLSGTDDLSEKERALACGATDYVTKPFDTSQITARVEALARQARQQREELRATGASEDPGTVDPVTGLSNLAYFEHHGAKNLSFTQRHNKELSIILISVDNIERLIDDQGREVVDQLLRKLGEFIVGAVRTLETVAHIAPYKFGIIAPMTNDIGVLELAYRIVKKVHKTVFRNSGGEIKFTVSMGLASPRVHLLKDFNQLVEIADRRLELAVKSGGDCIVHEDTIPHASTRHVESQQAEPQQLAARRSDGVGRGETAPLPDSSNPPPLETALWLLNNGQGEQLKEHYKPILTSLLPLLEHADKSWSLDLADSLNALRERLG